MAVSDRAKMFVQEYIVDLNQQQAAIRAGYSPKTAKMQASRLMARDDIKELVQQAMTERQQRTNITADYILTNLKNVAERCMQAEPVMVRDGKDWIESGEYKFDSAGANRALELLGKHLKLFTDKHEHTGANGGPIQTEQKTDLSKLSKEELMQLADLVAKSTKSGGD